MIQTIRIAYKKSSDPKGDSLLADIKRIFNIQTIKKIRTVKVYRLEGIGEKQALFLAEKLLFEPIDHIMAFNTRVFEDSKNVIEIAYKPGVMNPEVASIVKSAKDLGVHLKSADSSFEYVFYGNITAQELDKVISRLLLNDTIEYLVKKPPKTLIINGKTPKTKIIKIRDLDDKQLLKLAASGQLFLNLEEMKTIQDFFKKIKRDPSDFEIEVLAQTWSEHCGHKTFKANLTIDGEEKKPFITRIKETASNNKKIIVSAFVDNSGVIDFYDDYAICAKVETHNSPSAIEPYGGAMTGCGGVFRDILGTGQGAKVISSTDVFCFAPWDLKVSDIPPGCLPPDYLFKKVVSGVRDYGNRVGVPTNNGSVHFHEDFKAKPTVAVGAFGLIAKNKAQKGKPQVGDLILLVGGRTGRDGIHGATFSSGEMTAETIEVSGSAVQIGNAIEEKRVIDAILDMRDHDLIRAITDCGAGGLSSAVGEMGQDIGVMVNVDRVPLKYTGLAPWEIFLSESQERMVLAIPKGKIEQALEICTLHNVESSIIGNFDGNKKLKVNYLDLTVCDIDMKFLHDGLPQRHMVGKTLERKTISKSPPRPKNLVKIITTILTNGNVASKESFVRMYDHNVQGTSALHPFSGVDYSGPNDGAIVTPMLGKPYGLVVSHGINPILNKIDPYNGSIWAITEAVANFVSVGGKLEDAALIDNFIWPFPDEESLADLDKSVDACIDAAKILEMPFVSGKDSLSSTYRYPDGKVLKVPPVLLVSVFGKVGRVDKTLSSDFKKEGSVIVLLGKPDLDNLGGSVYFQVTGSTGMVPVVDLESFKKISLCLNQGIDSNRILACHDISEGGLITALSEMSFGGKVGAEIDLSKISPSVRHDFILLSETAGTFLVEVENEQTATELFGSVAYFVIGKTIKEPIIDLKSGAKSLCQIPILDLKTAWQRPIKEIFQN